MIGYSGYTEHSDYYIAPHDTWESAFEFLNIKWYKWNEDKGEWEYER